MKVIYSIKVHRDNLQQLQKLRYLARVDVGEDGKSITVQIKDNCTRGSLIARTGITSFSFPLERFRGMVARLTLTL